MIHIKRALAYIAIVSIVGAVGCSKPIVADELPTVQQREEVIDDKYKVGNEKDSTGAQAEVPSTLSEEDREYLENHDKYANETGYMLSQPKTKVVTSKKGSAGKPIEFGKVITTDYVDERQRIDCTLKLKVKEVIRGEKAEKLIYGDKKRGEDYPELDSSKNEEYMVVRMLVCCAEDRGPDQDGAWIEWRDFSYSPTGQYTEARYAIAPGYKGKTKHIPLGKTETFDIPLKRLGDCKPCIAFNDSVYMKLSKEDMKTANLKNIVLDLGCGVYKPADKAV